MSDAPLTPKQIEDGKLMALLAYGSFFFGLPLFAIPLLTRDNAFALKHAKYAGVLFAFSLGGALIFTVITTITCGFGAILYLALIFLYIPIFQGLLNALNGSAEPPMLVGNFAEQLFGGITLKEESATPQISAPPKASPPPPSGSDDAGTPPPLPPST